VPARDDPHHQRGRLCGLSAAAATDVRPRVEDRTAVRSGVDTQGLERAAQALLTRNPLSAQQLGDALAPAFPKAQREELARWIRACVPPVMVPTSDRYGYSRPPRFVAADQRLDRPLRAEGAARTGDLPI
jgi:hypothetical protein